jgi:serine carboxypeptidase-like clade 2
MPTLAKQIVDSNANTANPKLNFKGFAVGNPYTDPYSGTPAMIDTYWGHQLVSKPTFDDYTRACTKDKTSTQCSLAMAKILTEVGNLNPYALDYPVCTADSKSNAGTAQRLWQLHHQLKAVGIEPTSVGLKSKAEYEPCEDDYSEDYLNLQSVKEALHVKTNTKWESCSNKVDYSVADSTVVSTAPIYNYLIDGKFGLNILVYSGDDDGVCATIGTQEWIWGLGYEVAVNPWKTYTVNEQTAGYLTQWRDTKLAFLTIRGAGHEVPTYKPEAALDMWTRYLAGEFTNK